MSVERIMNKTDPVLWADLKNSEKHLADRITLLHESMLKLYDLQAKIERNSKIGDRLCAIEKLVLTTTAIAVDANTARRRYAVIAQGMVLLTVLALIFVSIFFAHIVQADCH
jgi:hypothetical protein